MTENHVYSAGQFKENAMTENHVYFVLEWRQMQWCRIPISYMPNEHMYSILKSI